MKKFAILRKDKTILVKTPIPYVVTAYQNNCDDEWIEDIRYCLDEDTKFLYNCLKVLGISKAVAKREEYTLNKATGDKLRSIALNNKGISYEIRQLILNHNW